MPRHPKAPSLRIADGTHRNGVHGPKEAYGSETLLTEVPKPPAKKKTEFVRRWKQYGGEMLQVGVLTARDLPALEALCDAHQDEADARADIARNGDYFPTMSGMARHPAFVTMEKARAFIQQAQMNLGFSPMGRAKVPPATGITKSSKVQGMNRKV